MGIFGNDAQSQVDLDDLKARVAKLEAAVATLQAQSSVPYGAPQAVALTPAVTSATSAALPMSEPAWMTEVRSLKADGKLINAIKVYRENTGLGLKEAKDAVEAMP